MLYIHPFWQMGGLVLALWALALGWQRFRSLHLGRRVTFKRNRHTFVGKLALWGWLLGILGGVAMVRWYWHGYFITGDHAAIGLAMAPMILFGVFTGIYLKRRPAPRVLLPLLHGLNNLALIVLAIIQINEGAEVIEHFVQGG